MFHTIVIGQGIAGTMLSWQLIRSGKNVLVIDHASHQNASGAASGVINPITGKRFVKSWMIDALIPAARATYTEMEGAFQTKFFRDVSIKHLFNSNEELNDWSAKANTPGYEHYLPSAETEKLNEHKVKNPFGCFTVQNACKVETNLLLKAARNWLKENNAFVEERFDEGKIKDSADGLYYKHFRAERIIFANGYHATQCHLFNSVKFTPVKGEGLLIEIEDFFPEHIIHGDVMITPTATANIYYVGSTYEWNFTDAQPTAAKRKELIKRIGNTIACPFKVVNHVAGIRPATNNRRPVMGMLPENQRIGIFNGMGTKGYSLAPFFAKHFCNHLLSGVPLMKETDLRRFF